MNKLENSKKDLEEITFQANVEGIENEKSKQKHGIKLSGQCGTELVTDNSSHTIALMLNLFF